MTSHPNRSGGSTAAGNPTPTAVRAAREAAGLTQTQAARLTHSTLRAWQEWEAGNRRMHPGLWELFQTKVSRGTHHCWRYSAGGSLVCDELPPALADVGIQEQSGDSARFYGGRYMIAESMSRATAEKIAENFGATLGKT